MNNAHTHSDLRVSVFGSLVLTKFTPFTHRSPIQLEKKKYNNINNIKALHYSSTVADTVVEQLLSNCCCCCLCCFFFPSDQLSSSSSAGLALSVGDKEYHGFLFADVGHDGGQLVDVAAVEMLCLP